MSEFAEVAPQVVAVLAPSPDRWEVRYACGHARLGGVGERRPGIGEPEACPHCPALPVGTRYLVGGTQRRVVFPTRADKVQYMREAGIRDAASPVVVSWARQFEGLPRPARERAILRFAQVAIRYERDPAWYDARGRRHGVEVLESPGVVAQRGFGDCDAKERFFRAICIACEVPAEIDPVLVGEDEFPHVRSKVWYEAGELRGWYGLEADEPGWLVADPTIVNSSIGRLPQRVMTGVVLAE